MTAKILIVEDESDISQYLQIVLEYCGYNALETASSGELAVQKVAKVNPDIILMDIGMAGQMDGITAAQTILKLFDIPIIYITAYSDEATLARAKVTSPYGYIVKPFEERQLRPTIEIALYKHKVERQLKENAQWLSTVLNSIGDGVITIDKKGHITFLNPVAENISGWLLKDAVNKPVSEVFKLIDETDYQLFNIPVAEILEKGEVFQLPKDIFLVRKDGKRIPIEDTVAPIANHNDIVPFKDSQGKPLGAVIIFRDITEKRITAQKLHRKAYYDSLTNLPNRAWFRERVGDAVERVKRNQDYLFAIMVLDLDRFKITNDSLGHLIGDKLLTAVAAKLMKVVRSIDTVARLGGDEFAILLESLQKPREACEVAQRIQQELSLPLILDGNEVFTSTSIGIVLSSTDRKHVDELIRDADIAMYRAKGRGHGCYELFDTQMRSQVMAMSQMESELRRAIERNELIVYYQPIISLPTQETVGYEALVRWSHPQRGLIYPDQFIPIAEDTGLIVQIDLWVLREACCQMKAWQGHSPSLTISVNLSSKQFLQLNCVARIQEILEAVGIEPKCLKLEITESTILENSSSVAAILAELKALGIALSLDDFGTGYSSLSYLQQFPFDVLKIDRCFVRNLDRNTKNATISKALIQIAHLLDLKVVAEGVETEAELACLARNRCDEVQGYLFSPPLAPAELV